MENVLSLIHIFYPFDEWQVWEIDSLIGMSRYKEGLEVYQNTEKLLFDEMGVAPSERLLKRFKLMGERTSQAAGALSDIKERLREKDAAVGAYFCPFPSFVDIYHVFSRMVERSGLSVFVMLCTLDYKACLLYTSRSCWRDYNYVQWIRFCKKSFQM